MVQISKKDTEKVLGLIYLWRNRHRRTGNVAAFLVVPPETFWITMQSQSKIGETPLPINNIRLSSSKNGESQRFHNRSNIYWPIVKCFSNRFSLSKR